MNNSKLHKKFKLNGESFTSEKEILDFSKHKLLELYPFLSDWFNDENYIAVQTSGSTGNPKTIQLKKEYMVNSAKATGTFFKLSDQTAALLCLSPNYIAGKMMLIRALTLGWHLDVIEPSSNPLVGIKKDYDFCAMVPLQLENSLPQLYRIKKVIVGGAPVSNSLLERIQNISTAIFATYGMTETITHIALKPLNEHAMSLRGGTTWQSQHYKTLPNISISKDTRDCLMINAPKLSDSPIITNDVVEILSETEFKWLGRFDTIINSGGVKLIPEEIEGKLASVIEERFFVAGILDEKLGEKLVLVIETSSLKLQTLKLEIESLTALERFEIPKEIYTVKTFVETETKKIQRKKTLDLVFKNK